MRINSKNIFLVDGLGAIFSASVLGVVLVNFQGLFGMPQQVLFYLMIVACIFSFYSLGCHFFKPANWQSFLLFIAISNTIYCIISVAFAFYHIDTLTTLGCLYFVSEVIVVMLLVNLEVKNATPRG